LDRSGRPLGWAHSRYSSGSSTPAFRPVAATCGVERWRIKTLQDWKAEDDVDDEGGDDVKALSEEDLRRFLLAVAPRWRFFE